MHSFWFAILLCESFTFSCAIYKVLHILFFYWATTAYKYKLNFNCALSPKWHNLCLNKDNGSILALVLFCCVISVLQNKINNYCCLQMQCIYCALIKNSVVHSGFVLVSVCNSYLCYCNTQLFSKYSNFQQITTWYTKLQLSLTELSKLYIISAATICIKCMKRDIILYCEQQNGLYLLTYILNYMLQL